ncbi:hypothetical protein Q9F39_004202 [Vibrio fluvialis]|nr:hypothetical protein [Vibrio fluvialis]
MTWLTKNLKTFISENPDKSVKWYALQFGCCEATVIKVQKEMADQSVAFRPWMKAVEERIKRDSMFNDDWKNWQPWQQLYRSGLSPKNAVMRVI